jgi:D-sedoheptulose 7-phosphate isomerase
MMMDKIKEQISESILVKSRILENDEMLQAVRQAATEIIGAYKAGYKTLLVGNGGSAADAQHIAGEFVSRFYFDRPALPSIALTTDSSVLTAVGNDYGFERVFARQVEALGVKGDVLIAISTSGNSLNVVEALRVCREKGIFAIGLTGQNMSRMDELCNICIKVPSTVTPRIQESHILIGHILCNIVEEELFGYLNTAK